MNKATPIPDTIQIIPNGTLETAVCRPCGKKITRARAFHGPFRMPWWHVHSMLSSCAAGGK